MVSSVNKRARAAMVYNFDSLSCDEIALGRNNEPLLDGDVPRINLTPTGFLMVRYGFNISAESACYSPGLLSIRVALSAAQLNFFKTFDDKCRKLYSERHTDVDWLPITRHIEREELWTIKVNVYFDKNTIMRVCDEDGPVVVVDWEHALELIKNNGCFHRADVKLVVKPEQVWNYNGKAGLSLTATQLALRPAVAPQEIDVFAHAEW
jgi:hypothetical protein